LFKEKQEPEENDAAYTHLRHSPHKCKPRGNPKT